MIGTVWYRPTDNITFLVIQKLDSKYANHYVAFNLISKSKVNLWRNGDRMFAFHGKINSGTFELTRLTF